MGQSTSDDEVEGLLRNSLIEAGVDQPDVVIEKWRLDREREILDAARAIRQVKPTLDALKDRTPEGPSQGDRPEPAVSMPDQQRVRNLLAEMEGRLAATAGRVQRLVKAMDEAMDQSSAISDRAAENLADVQSAVADLNASVVSKGKTLVTLLLVALAISLSTALVGTVFMLAARP
ncbi:MAG: hypothetical protein OXG82_00190 [Gammaproteobacteria bacterium]|nr:hypothetical protein [Gammaproteobacteria bacterium]